jgi:cell division protein FtsI (penicillin-binding protein 3)
MSSLRKAILLRSRIVLIFILLFAVVVFYHAVDLAIFKKEKYEAIRIKNSTRIREVKAIRGNILSTDGRLLATSMPKYDIVFDPLAIKSEEFNNKIDSLALLLAVNFSNKNYQGWRNYLINSRSRGERYVLIQRKVAYELAKDMAEWPIFRNGRYQGGFIKEEHTVREMPFGNIARRTIGFVSPNGQMVGLENAFDSILRGKSGERMEQRVSSKIWRPVGNTEFKPSNGLDIITTLDVGIQDVAEDALKKALYNSNAQSGCAVIMEVKTGAVRAIANFSRMSNGSYFEDINLAISIASDPGSTMKLASAMALIEEQKIKSLDDSVVINYGKRKFFDRDLYDSDYPSANHKLTFRQVFEKSSNVGIAGAVYDHFANKPMDFLKYLSALNMDRPLGLEIQEEGNILIKDPSRKDWTQISMPWTSIGYESRVTPMQTLAMYNAIANDGFFVKPFFVEKISRFGKTLWEYEAEVSQKSVCSPRTLGLLKELLVGVVQNGTATNLKNPNYQVAGKTGTVQVLVGTKYDKGLHKGTFVGYFPAENPQYTCIVVINAPAGGEYYGGRIAGPVFLEIADKVYAGRHDLHPVLAKQKEIQLPQVKYGNKEDIKKVLNELGISSSTSNSSTSGSDWVRSSTSQFYVNLKEMEENKDLVPDVRGMGLRDALFILENLGLNVSVQGYGKVIYQNIKPGSKFNTGDQIFIELK